jgi:bifunctional UDP-N-acetylglucosamine pyrophosphorylase/glucosamine-1-phosphate N-acetyltransferase
MGASTPKVLLRLEGRTLLAHVVDSARAAGAGRILVVVGEGRELVMAEFRDKGLEFAVQEHQRGTADAVHSCRALLNDDEDCVVLCGDAPLVRPETIRRLTVDRDRAAADVAVFTALLDTPGSYGRVVRLGGNQIDRIVESRDAVEAELRIREVNSGAYSFRWGRVKDALARIRPSAVSGELYLTNLVSEIRSEGGQVIAVLAGEPTEMLGANTPEDFALIENELHRRRGTAA